MKFLDLFLALVFIILNLFSKAQVTTSSLSNNDSIIASNDFISRPTPEKYLLDKISKVVNDSDCFCTGTLVFGLMVEKDGQLSEVRIVRGLNNRLDKLVKEIIVNSSPWCPGIKDGLAVKSYFLFPIKFGAPVTIPCNEDN